MSAFGYRGGKGNQPARNPSDYKHILAWGRMLGSSPGYIMQQQQKAARDHAPLDAVFESGGRWRCYADVTSERSRRQLDQILTLQLGVTLEPQKEEEL